MLMLTLHIFLEIIVLFKHKRSEDLNRAASWVSKTDVLVHKRNTQVVYLTINPCCLVAERRITEPSPSMCLSRALPVLLIPEL